MKEKIKEFFKRLYNVQQWREATPEEQEKYKKVHKTLCTLLYIFESGFIEKNPFSSLYDGKRMRYHRGNPFSPEGHPDNGISLEELGLEIFNPNYYKILENLPFDEREDFERFYEPGEEDFILVSYLAGRRDFHFYEKGGNPKMGKIFDEILNSITQETPGVSWVVDYVRADYYGHSQG